jgi:hypothetical protein
MAEQYEVAAWRHVRTAEKLLAELEYDDSGYHAGIAGENIVKALLQNSGLEAYWQSLAIPMQQTPMRGHFPKLHSMISQVRADIASSASGRQSANPSAVVLDPSFANRFAGWDINIRYADTTCTPVSKAVSETWLADAHDLILTITA